MPDTLHVMGRIAHMQVWDYMDKLRSSLTRVRGSDQCGLLEVGVVYWKWVWFMFSPAKQAMVSVVNLSWRHGS